MAGRSPTRAAFLDGGGEAANNIRRERGAAPLVFRRYAVRRVRRRSKKLVVIRCVPALRGGSNAMILDSTHSGVARGFLACGSGAPATEL